MEATGEMFELLSGRIGVMLHELTLKWMRSDCLLIERLGGRIGVMLHELTLKWTSERAVSVCSWRWKRSDCLHIAGNISGAARDIGVSTYKHE
jgi:hypothetical protein